LFGQFLSWTLAKSAQTNKLLQRIENGDARQMVKLLSGISVYGGIQNLREISKYGEITTDLETETDKWYSNALRLSGITGTLPELFLNQLSGPGSRQPWFLFAPFTSILDDAGQVTKDAIMGDWDAAQKRFLQKIAPAPIFTKFIMNLFSDKDYITPVGSTDIGSKIKKTFKRGGRVGYDEGDIVLPMSKPTIDMSKLEGVKKVEKNEIYDDKEFVKYMKIVENNELRLGNKNKLVHPSAEGGNDTVAYGHKLTDKEKETGMIYEYKISELTREQQDDILRRDLENAEIKLQMNYPEEYSLLDKRKKQMLIDFQFNGGEGMVDLFENFRTGLFEGDENKMKKEYERGYYKDGDFKKLTERNKEFAKFFFKKLKEDK
jgi:GH24 family phage-related lysozyme (muramidase)